MKVRLGNFIYHHRNVMFPMFYVLLFLKGPLLMPDFRIAAIIGVLVAATGQLIRGVTVGLDYIKRGGLNRMPYADDLVQGGIFAHCRNPLYVGNFSILLGTGIASNSLLFAAIGIPFFIFAYTCIIAAEENYLRGKFGAEFNEYCRRVNRVLPRLAGLGGTLAGMRFNWRRLITAEYNSAFIWIIACHAAILQNIWLAGEYTKDSPLVRALHIGVGLTLLAYLVARILKKSGRLQQPALQTATY
ncbi:methyltransferase family protein [Haloferula sp.]|uniref:methyltransferase family protein n=1 Tax=Haloferula sp. TaxID=2497595 RepID=UPI003C7859FC